MSLAQWSSNTNLFSCHDVMPYYRLDLNTIFFVIIFISGAPSETKDQDIKYAFSSISPATV